MIQYSVPNIELTSDDYKIIKQILDDGRVSIGRYNELLEEHFTDITNFKYAIAVNNATTGLIIALKAAGWKGKKIGVPAFTWPSTIYALESNNNIPVFCDITTDGWHLIAPEGIDYLMPVDTFGKPAGLYNHQCIYDSAHSYGVESLGLRNELAAVISMSFTKPVTATEGGMILTNESTVAEIAKELRRLSGRLPEVNAFVGLRSAEKYKSKFMEHRAGVVQKYKAKLDFDFSTQKTEDYYNDSVFSILLPSSIERDAIRKALTDNQIEIKVYYEPLVSGLPNTDNIFSRIISLPIHKDIDKHQDMIIELANNAVKTAYVPGKRYLRESGYLKKYLRRDLSESNTYTTILP